MSKVLAKFRMTECTSQREVEHERTATGSYEPKTAVETCHVKMSAVQGEPFGKYTPMGTVDMFIKNPAAAKVFSDRWHAYVQSDDVKAQPPEFYLEFVPAEEHPEYEGLVSPLTAALAVFTPADAAEEKASEKQHPKN